MLARQAALVLAIALSALSCVAPTLPLPPPDAPQVSRGEGDSTFHLSGPHGAQPNAIVVVVNLSQDVPRSKRVSGAQADQGGSWECDVFARAGDFLDLTQEIGTARSPSITVRVPR
jgi:hypothetical protein